MSRQYLSIRPELELQELVPEFALVPHVVPHVEVTVRHLADGCSGDCLAANLQSDISFTSLQRKADAAIHPGAPLPEQTRTNLFCSSGTTPPSLI